MWYNVQLRPAPTQREKAPEQVRANRAKFHGFGPCASGGCCIPLWELLFGEATKLTRYNLQRSLDSAVMTITRACDFPSDIETHPSTVGPVPMAHSTTETLVATPSNEFLPYSEPVPFMTGIASHTSGGAESPKTTSTWFANRAGGKGCLAAGSKREGTARESHMRATRIWLRWLGPVQASAERTHSSQIVVRHPLRPIEA